LPSGTATFLFADIGGSARVSEQLGSRYADVLAEFRRLLRVAAHNQDGREIGVHGDGSTEESLVPDF
jgi:class 3 adenylate cyclase